MLNAVKNVGKFVKNHLEIKANTRVLREMDGDLSSLRQRANEDYAGLQEIAKDIEDLARSLKRDDSMVQIVKEAQRGVEYIRGQMNISISEVNRIEDLNASLVQKGNLRSPNSMLSASEERLKNNMQIVSEFAKIRGEIWDVRSQLEKARDDVTSQLDNKPSVTLPVYEPASVGNVISIHDRLLAQDMRTPYTDSDPNYTPSR